MIETFSIQSATITLLGKENNGKVPDCIYLEQEHGTYIHSFPKKLGCVGDGIVGEIGRDTYAIKVADCLGVVIVGKKYFVVVHVGWKGLYKGLIHYAVQKMYRHGERVIDMVVRMSPCIHFLEVGEDGSDFGTIVPERYLCTTPGGYKEIDTLGRAMSQLLFHGFGGEDITIHDDCTLEKSDKWYSYRNGDIKKRNRIMVGE